MLQGQTSKEALVSNIIKQLSGHEIQDVARGGAISPQKTLVSPPNNFHLNPKMMKGFRSEDLLFIGGHI